MSTTSMYQQFLAAPNSSLLASNASLHYITTTTSFNGPTEIIKHLSTQAQKLKKDKEEVLYSIEGPSDLAVEVNTTIKFDLSGGAYLPNLDDNFLADRVVHLPIMHIVNLDGDGKICQIRQSWDQGSLLKQLEVIGKTGRNWPIRDSQEQIRLITTSLKASGQTSSKPDAGEIINRSRQSSQNALRDPHASLSLFAPREQQLEEASESIVTPYAGTRPRQRDFTDIINEGPGDGNEDEPASPSAAASKRVAPKLGAGKNFAPSRLFGTEEEAEAAMGPNSPENNNSPSKFRVPHPKKYQHFDFADGSDPQDAAAAAEEAAAQAAKRQSRSNKHNSSWSFEDFTTPQKVNPSKAMRHQDVRHWGEGSQEPTPVVQQKPRRDAETHFEFMDDGEPIAGHARPAGRPRGSTHNDGLHLYENNLYNEDGSAPTPGPARALGNITNLSDRRKDFDSHWDMNDESPATGGQRTSKITDDRKKAVNMMNSNWSSYDKSPAPTKENKPISNDGGIHIAGDGMGGKKGTNRDWLYGDELAEEEVYKPQGRKAGPPQASRDFWDF